MHSYIAYLPAKAATLNIKQFNGYYGCLYCFHPGLYSKEYSKQIYPPDELQNKLLTVKNYVKISNHATENNEYVYGIKGHTPLASLIKIPTQVPLDYMHLVLQGHTKWLLNQYINSHKSNGYFIGHKL